MSLSHTAPAPRTAPRTALVVDDQPVNRLLAARLLGKAGWTVTQTESGEEALAWLAAHQVTLMLLDISMPNLSGQEVCRRVRDERLGGPDLRVVAYTAHAMPEECDEFLAAGFDAILVKPIGRASMDRVLAEVGLAEMEASP